MFNKVSRIAAFGAFAVLGAQPAWAIDADQFGARLKDAVQLLGIAIDYGSASVAGDTVTLSDFTIFVPGEDNAELPGDVIFSGVAETGDGGFTAQSASIADVELEDLEDGFSVSLRNVAVEGITLPGTIDVNDLLPAAMGLYRSASAGPLIVSQDGAEIFAIDGVLTTIDGPADNGDFASRVAIEGIRADLSAVPDAEAQELIATFGVEQFSASLTGSSIWNPDTSLAEINDFIIVIDGLGSLTMDASVTGYDRAFYQDLMKINLKLSDLARSDEEIPDSEMARIEQAMADKFTAVEIEGFSIRYDDNSLFMKVLDLIAAEQGIDGQTFASGLKFMVPMMMVDLPDADFKASVTAQVNAFLDDPQNFTISAEPETPVSLTSLAIAEEDPFALVELLNINVLANQ